MSRTGGEPLLQNAMWQKREGLTSCRFVQLFHAMDIDSDHLQTAGQSSQADVCFYSLFLPENRSSSLETPDLKAFCAEILAYAESLCIDPTTSKNYIWQREAFTLSPAEDGRSLKGQTSFGESVEDEWFIVYLLRHITGKYKDLVAKIEDTDGQFLLIEAAEVLPAWLNPDNAENRVCQS